MYIANLEYNHSNYNRTWAKDDLVTFDFSITMFLCVHHRCRLCQMCHMFQSSKGRKNTHNLSHMKADSAPRICRCYSSIPKPLKLLIPWYPLWLKVAFCKSVCEILTTPSVKSRKRDHFKKKKTFALKLSACYTYLTIEINLIFAFLSVLLLFVSF